MRSFMRWDSVFFQRIAERGYEYEQVRQQHPSQSSHNALFQFLAFMPLYPALIRAVAAGLAPSGPPDAATLACAAVLLNTAAFAASTAGLYRLAQAAPDHVAWAACLVHLASPATPFFNAGYSESLYCALVVAASLLQAR